MRPAALFLAALSAVPLLAQAEACIVHSQGAKVDVKVCQQNRNIPKKLFREGFCQPQLKDQKVEVTFADSCPSGAFGICENAQAQGAPYRQDIHYYGVASDARILEPFCETQSKGQWRKPE